MAKGSGRHFRDKSRGKPQRKRKPVVLLIAEGQNKTEKLYFQHFSTPESKYAVKVVSRGETDPQGMLETLKRECLKDDVSAGDDIAGIILDLDCNESRTKQVWTSCKLRKIANTRYLLPTPALKFGLWPIFMSYVEHTRGLARCWRI